MTPPAPRGGRDPLARPSTQNTKAAKILSAAAHLLPSLERGLALDARILREAMTAAFEASDQDGAWLWKDAYEASEAAAVLFLRKYGPGMLRKAGSPCPLSFHAGTALGAAALAHAPLGGKRPVPAILHAARPWLSDEPCRASSARASSCSNPRQAPAFLPFMPRSPEPRSHSTNSPKPATPCSRRCFRRRPSRASTPSRSTIISMRASRPRPC